MTAIKKLHEGALGLTIVLAVFQATTSAAVYINEVVKDERTATTAAISPDKREFIELYNSGATPINLENYTIRTTNLSTSSFTDDTLPGGATIAPGGYFVIAVDGGALDAIANYKLNIGASEFFPDSVPLLIELVDNNASLLDAVAFDAYRTPQLTGLTAPQLAQVGTGLQGRAESYNPSAATVPNVTMSYARYRNGVDTNRNGHDFGYLPVTPGASNALPLIATHVVPNVDSMTAGDLISDYNASFVAPRVVAPNVVNVGNPSAIIPSPQGGNAISAWDETGGGNVVYSKNYVNKFDLWAYLDTTSLSLNTGDWEAEWTAYGIGSSDPQFRTPNPFGNIPSGATSTISENGSTGIGWFYERFENADQSDEFTLSIVDFGQGGNGVPSAQGDQQWEIIQTFNLTPADNGWHRLSVQYDPATGAVEAKFDSNTVNFTTATNLVGTFYAGYREGMTNVPGTNDPRVRPATWDMIATVAVQDADFNNDSKVDAADLSLWASNFGNNPPVTNGDANGDGKADGADFLIWQQQYKPTAGVTGVPEPASGMLAGLMAALLGLHARGRRMG